MKPRKSILDPTFRYTNSGQTDIAKTFARVRREQRKAEVDAPPATTAALSQIFPFPPKKAQP